MSTVGLSFREGAAADLASTFALSEHATYEVAARHAIVPAGQEPTDAEVRAAWLRQRGLLEFMAAQDGRYCICEGDDGPVGYARTVSFGGMDELSELMIRPDHQGRGIGRALLERCWHGDPTPDAARIVIAAGAPADLSLYTTFGVMPITGHWHMRQRTEAYLEARSNETDAVDAASVHVLEADRAVSEWRRLEPAAIGHERPELHRFFARDRNCLAQIDPQTHEATALCWVSGDGDIGPAVGAWPKDVVPVILAALDRVAKAQEPEFLSVFTTTISWWLLRRLRGLGFTVHWPSWILCSVPLPGLDRYAPTRPPRLL